MAVNYVKGQILSSNLERDGIDLSISNANIGINTLSPQARLDVVGNVLIGNVTIGNIGTVSASGNITGGNVLTGGQVSSTGNVTGGNVLTGGLISVTGNITSDNVIFSATTSVTGNSYANIFVGNIAVIGTVSATSNVLVGNVVIPSSGNISAGNVNIKNLLNPVQNQDAATKYYVDQASGNIGNIGNLAFANTTITTDGTIGNIVLEPTGTGVVYIDATSGLILPVGNTAQRPSPATQGTVRFNSDNLRVEVYDGTEWDQVVGGVTNQTLNGDGSTTTFTLDRSTTSAAAMVMLNGVVQLPGTAYNMTPNPSTTLVFTEAPAVSDKIDIRFL